MKIKNLKGKTLINENILKKIFLKGKTFFAKKNAIKRSINGKGNVIKLNKTSRLKQCRLIIEGNNNIIEIGGDSSFNHVLFYINGSNHFIKIGENVSFNRGSEIWVEDQNCQILIGNNTTFENVHLAVTELGSAINIGSDCMFAYDIDIRTGDSHSILDKTTGKRINYAKNVTIEDHVWVASHCSILKGVQIAANSIVATRSVVTKPFTKSNLLIGGSPAIVLKEQLTWERKRIYDV